MQIYSKDTHPACTWVGKKDLGCVQMFISTRKIFFELERKCVAAQPLESYINRPWKAAPWSTSAFRGAHYLTACTLPYLESRWTIDRQPLGFKLLCGQPSWAAHVAFKPHVAMNQGRDKLPWPWFLAPVGSAISTPAAAQLDGKGSI